MKIWLVLKWGWSICTPSSSLTTFGTICCGKLRQRRGRVATNLHVSIGRSPWSLGPPHLNYWDRYSTFAYIASRHRGIISRYPLTPSWRMGSRKGRCNGGACRLFWKRLCFEFSHATPQETRFELQRNFSVSNIFAVFNEFVSIFLPTAYVGMGLSFFFLFGYTRGTTTVDCYHWVEQQNDMPAPANHPLPEWIMR